MITRAPIVNAKSNLKMTQEYLDRVYLQNQCNTFRINNVLVYQILWKVFMDMDSYVSMKQRKSMQDC